jgi:hypothetical protein
MLHKKHTKKKRNDDDQPRKTIVKPIDFPWKSRLLISCTAAENPGPRSWTMKVTFIEGLGSRNWRGRGLRCVLLAAASYTPYIYNNNNYYYYTIIYTVLFIFDFIRILLKTLSEILTVMVHFPVSNCSKPLLFMLTSHIPSGVVKHGWKTSQQ